MILVHAPSFAGHRQCLALAALIGCLAASQGPRLAAAEPPAPPEIVSLRPALGEHYKQGCWAPFEVRLRGGGQSTIVQLEVGLPDADGVQTFAPLPDGRAVRLTAGEETTAQVFLKVGSLRPTFTARMIVEGLSRPIEREFVTGDRDAPAEALEALRPLYVCLGGRAEIDRHEKEPNLPAPFRPVVEQVDSAEQLPTRWFGYEGVDAVALFSDKPGALRGLTPGSARWTALDGWLRRGGLMVFCAGRAAAETLAADSPLAALAPGRFVEVAPLRQTTAFETFAESNEPLRLAAGPRGAAGLIQVARLVDARGKVEAFEGTRTSNLPLIIRYPYGLGEVVFVAVDLDRPPFSSWPGQRQLWDKLLNRDRPPLEQEQAGGQLTRLGYDDLAGQLHSSLEQFAGVSVPFSLVVTLIVIYILCIGPLDYFLLKRYLRRMERTWFTFPAVVIFFSVGAYLLARELKGEQLRVNQVDLVDFDVATGLARGAMWSMVFSPQSDLYNVAVEPRLPRAAGAGASGAGESSAGQPKKGQPKKGEDEPVNEPVRSETLLSWLGLPGEGLGGMAVRSPAVSLFDNAYRFGPELATLDGVPIAVWSTKGLTARWTAEKQRLASSELESTVDGLVRGTIENASAMRLQKAVLLFDRWAYPLGDVEPGRTIRIDGRIDPQTVETYFKRAAVGEHSRALEPYFASSLDVERVMEMLMLHDSVGGSTYTRLTNAYQGYLDATRQLRAGRAVLIARAAEPATVLKRDDRPLAGPQDRHWTFYRFMLPVAPPKR